MTRHLAETADYVMMCAQLAAALEVSGYPKPGNVHRTADFPDLRFEDFLAGSVALGPPIRRVAWRGRLASMNRLRMDQLKVGQAVKESVDAAPWWHKGGNTHLGTVLLFSPLAAAAGLCGAVPTINPTSLRGEVKRVINATTYRDAEDAFSAILQATPATLGRLKTHEYPDISARRDENELAERTTLLEAMHLSSRWDGIASEWVTYLSKVFNLGYPTLTKVFTTTRNINIAVVHTFLTLLSRSPDTFLARKVGLKETPFIEDAVQIGLERTRWVSKAAERALALKGLLTHEGSKAIESLDTQLRTQGSGINPGTTADLTGASLFVALLCGWRF